MPAELITPEVIAAECLKIQAEWTPEIRLRRMRVDMRPVFRRADGVIEEIDSADYESHLENGGCRADDGTRR